MNLHGPYEDISIIRRCCLRRELSIVEMLLLLFVPLLLFFHAVSSRPSRAKGPAHSRRKPSLPHVQRPTEVLPVVSRNGTQLPPYDYSYVFQQLIDHNNPSLGTFRQRYWHTYEFYESGAFCMRFWYRSAGT